MPAIIGAIAAGFGSYTEQRMRTLSEQVAPRARLPDRRTTERALERLTQGIGTEGIAENLLANDAVGIEHAHLQGVIEAIGVAMRLNPKLRAISATSSLSGSESASWRHVWTGARRTRASPWSESVG